MQRHDLVFVCPEAWRSMLATRSDLAGDPLVARWADNGWPLIGRRPIPGEAPGVALGLPLPPFAGKRRLSFVMQSEDVISISRPPALRIASRVAPRAWRPTLDTLAEIASQHAVEASVFGSLAWRALTGLDYLTDQSDLDVLFHIDRDTDLYGLTADIAVADALAPMRIDGELMRSNGAAVNWREIHTGATEILVKTTGGVGLFETDLFRLGRIPS
ncbi:malonate decarboxylase holo-[acyl-carrier-protein] synthase [Hyphomicrobium facile]|uniref:Phosphoribosyl-dephospho-CoA transferase n=1 Tax=Hyphomicrobium facile TaxID=51670 RepID=A0A1I7NQV5_9HYPH|nr:malonate decarboxylase holo-[acyl-carrier-protein] synthase [Hyphomicrobium facile]SFV37049.1 phosphoribosyl-dephospho-CoA transferase [Hyphomicrobium facile]